MLIWNIAVKVLFLTEMQLQNKKKYMAKTDYNSIIRNKIRDFIGSKKWSVSRFASRYVEEFIKLYSRQEAPSTSTSRKLVEEEGHVYTEREVTVLDSFTNMDFYQTWLEGEKAKVIELTNRYLGTENGGTSIDSPAMLHDSIAKLSRKDVNITLDDIDDLLRRYVALDSRAPFILISPSRLLMQAVLRPISPRHEIVKMNPENATDEIKTLLGIASDGKKVIGWIVTDQYKPYDKIKDVFGKDVFLLKFKWTDGMAESLKRRAANKCPANRAWLSGRMSSCLKVRNDWSNQFKKMIEACLKSPWVEFPEFENAGQCMAFLESKHHQFEPIFENEYMRNELMRLVDTQLPEKWLMNECNPQALLQCMLCYKEWKSNKEFDIGRIDSVETREIYRKALDKFDHIEFAALMLWGNTVDYDYSSWNDWFEDRFIVYLVEPDYYKLIDVIRAKTIRNEK